MTKAAADLLSGGLTVGVTAGVTAGITAGATAGPGSSGKDSLSADGSCSNEECFQKWDNIQDRNNTQNETCKFVIYFCLCFCFNVVSI